MRKRAFLVVVPVAMVILGILAGCVGSGSGAGVSASALPSVSSAAGGTPDAAHGGTPGSDATSARPAPGETARPVSSDGHLTCANLVGTADVTRAFLRPVSTATIAVVAKAPIRSLDDLAVEAAGGLSCSWRVGPPATGSFQPDTGQWGYASVSVLPHAAHRWTSYLRGDGPDPQRRTFGGVTAAAACGDPGCWVSAAIGDSWVQMQFDVNVREGGGWLFGNAKDDEIFGAMTPAVTSVFRTIGTASEAQLTWNGRGEETAGRCEGIVRSASVSNIEGDDGFAWDEDGSGMAAAVHYQFGLAAQRAGLFRCYGSGGSRSVTLLFGRDQGWMIDAIAADPGLSGGLRPTALSGLVAGERALSDCPPGDANATCSVYFSLGSAAVEIEQSPRAVAVATAVLEFAR